MLVLYGDVSKLGIAQFSKSRQRAYDSFKKKGLSVDWRDLSGIRAADFSGLLSVEGSKNRFQKPRSKDQSLNYLQLSHEKKPLLLSMILVG